MTHLRIGSGLLVVIQGSEYRCECPDCKFIRPHMALNGKTPAEKASINLNLEGNRWMNLIKQSAQTNPVKTALGELSDSIEIVEEVDSTKVKPKKWVDREAWMKANSILKTFGFAWLSQGKDSLWLKPLDMHHSPRTTDKT